jgi:CubicO group peptidase (beta-lactamase class C family)
MRERLRVLLLALLAPVALVQARPADIAAKAGEYAAAQHKLGRFMGAMLVARDGKILFENGYGWANAEWQVPNTARTKFRLGSVTKQFTAVAVLQLVEKGKIALDDPVSKYYAAAPEAWSKVTVFHLLTHTSGIPSYTGLPGFIQNKARDPLTPEAIVKLSHDLPLEFAPGEKFAYNNTGYVLLGYIIEKVSGMRYADYLRRNVFDPAGLADTGYDVSGEVLSRRASGYSGTVNALRNCKYLDMTLPFAAGALYSTVEDLFRWDQALYSEKLISAASREKMFTPFKNNYGFGWAITKSDGRLQQAHGGGIFGFNTYVLRSPEDRIYVAVLSNLESPLPGKIAKDLAEIARGEKVEIPSSRKEIMLAPEVVERFVGRYESESPKMSFTVTREGAQMSIQATGQSKTAVKAVAPNRFYFEAVDAEFEFHSDGGGKVTGFTLRQQGRQVEANRVP